MLGNPGLRAVKLNQKMRQFWQACAGILVDRRNGCGVDKLDPRHRQPHLDGVNNCGHRLVYGVETAHAGRDGFGLALQAQGQFGNQPQRAFGANK